MHSENMPTSRPILCQKTTDIALHLNIDNINLYLMCVPTWERNLKGHVYECSSSGMQTLTTLHYILLRGSGNAVTHCLSTEC
jgi:hypothetical protein